MAAVGAGVVMATLDTSIVNIALPTIRDEFGASFQAIEWVPLGYLLTIATLTLGTGRLGDILGKKRIYTTGFVLFTIASALCGSAQNIEMLLATRLLQAFGAVMILALGAAILTEAFPPDQRGRALGFIGTFVSIGIMAGPALGGVLIAAFSWRAIFFVNVPVGLVGLVLVLTQIPDTKPVPGQRLDVPGMALLSVTLFCFAFAVTRSQEVGFTDPLNLVLMVAAVASAAAWIRVERRVESPMLRLEFFRNPMLFVSVITGFTVFMMIAPAFFLLPFYLSGVLDLPIRTVGLLLGVAPIAIGVSAPYAGVLSDKLGIERIRLAGLVMVALATIGFQFLTTTTSEWQFALIAAPLGLGLGVFQSPNNSAIMGSMPAAYSGAGAGILTLTRLLGQVTGIAVLGTLWASRVVSLSGDPSFASNASSAPPGFQAAALREVYLWALPVIAAATLVGLWDLRRRRRTT